ncbi:hypothetical protein [Geminocystis sp. NIES-3709]|uniref:hypothetical protein n=1 Tax=Geminocystis sp. NIES-3709 TaxID=1617448 RepID=UPI0005FCC33E|nr:hypothetical protein [Geminocystis sp. NIES-3709]BAQ65702.1 hypothetical protein GM3709_2467 [Geminocystis sp. NIES-3709]
MLNFSKSYEEKLVKELIIITEKVEKNKFNNISCLNNLNKTISDMESYCRIWGETLKNNLMLSQARLGLIALSLHYYQNIFYTLFDRQLPQEIT